MSLLGFQLAMARLAASPALCVEVRRDPAPFLDGFDLTERERRRVADAAAQRGMQVHCTLYRAGRIGQMVAVLPLSCFLLGDHFRREAEAFWERHPHPDPMSPRELPRWAAFLHDRLRAGALDSPYLAEVVGYEMAHFQVGMAPPPAPGLDSPGAEGGPLRLDPRLRVVPFRHDPVRLLRYLTERRPPPYADLEEGEFNLLVDGRGLERVSGAITPSLARALRAVEDGTALSSENERVLLSAGLVVRAPAAEPVGAA